MATARTSPYMGLDSFTEADSALFHGREDETNELFHVVQRETLVLVFGVSGLGKSSLLRAGLFPRLREAHFFPIVIRLTYGTDDLVGQIRSGIAAQIEQHGIDAAVPTEDQTLWEYFHRTPFWDQRNRALVPVLVLDQFEEFFTLGQHDEHRDELITALGDLVENRIPDSFRRQADANDLPPSYEHPKAKVILSLREDYLARLEDLRPALPSLVRGRFRLHRMDGTQAIRAIRHEQTKHLVDEACAETIARFVAGMGGELELSELTIEPALLSLVCRELDELRMRRSEPSISTDLLSGESNRILDDFYARAIAGVADSVTAFIEDHLLTPNGHRTTVALSAIEDPPERKQAIETLVDRRILRIEQRLGLPHVEVIHDVLTPVMTKRRDTRRVAAERKRRKQRSISRALWAGSALAIVMIGIGVALYVNARHRLQVRRHQYLMKSSGVLVQEAATLRTNGDFWDSARLLEVAYGIEDTDRSPELALAAHRVTALYPMLFKSLRVSGSRDISSVSFSADGSKLFAVSADGSVTYWDTTTWKQNSIGSSDKVAKVERRPKPGALPAAGSPTDGIQRSPRGGARKPVGPTTADTVTFPQRLVGFAVSGDGKRAVILTTSAITLWDLARPHPHALGSKPIDKLGAAARVAINRNGSWVAVSGGTPYLLHYEGHHKLQLATNWSAPAGTLVASHNAKPSASSGDDGSPVNCQPASFDSREKPSQCVAQAAFSGDGNVLAVLGAPGVTLWHLGESTKRTNTLDRPASSFAISYDASTLAIASDGLSRFKYCFLNHHVTAAECRLPALQDDGFVVYHLRSHAPTAFIAGTGITFDRADPQLALVEQQRALEVRQKATNQTRTIQTPCDVRAKLLRKNKLVVVDDCGNIQVSDPQHHTFTHLPLEKGAHVSVSSDFLAEGRSGGRIRVWKLSGGADRIISMQDPVGPIAKRKPFVLGYPTQNGTLAVTKDGRTAVAGAVERPDLAAEYDSDAAGNEILGIFDVSGNKIKQLNKSPMDHPRNAKGERGVEHIELSPDESRILTVGRDRRARIWRRQDGAALFAIGNEQKRPILFAHYTVDGRHIVTADRFGTLCTWDADDGRRIACVKGSDRPSAFAVSRRGAVIGDEQGNVLFWDLLADHKPAPVGHQKRYVDDVAVDPSGRWVASGSEDGTARVWECTTGCRVALELDEKSPFYSVHLVTRGAQTLLVATTRAPRAYIVALDKPTQTRVLPLQGWASSVDVQKGRLLLCEFGDVEEWNLDTGRLTGRISLRHGRRNESRWCEARYISGQRVITHYSDGSLALWAHKAFTAGLSRGLPVRTLLVSKDGKELTTFDGEDVRRLDASTGAVTVTTPGATPPGAASDGRVLFGSPTGGVETLGGEPWIPIKRHWRRASVVAEGHGQVLAVGRDLHYRSAATTALDNTTAGVIAPSSPHEGIFDVGAAPSGKWFLAQAGNGWVTRYDADGHRSSGEMSDDQPQGVIPAVDGDGVLVLGRSQVLAWPASGAATRLRLTSRLNNRAAAWDVRLGGVLLATSASIQRRALNGSVLWNHPPPREEPYDFSAATIEAGKAGTAGMSGMSGASDQAGKKPLAMVASREQLGLFSFEKGDPIAWSHVRADDAGSPKKIWAVPDEKAVLSLDQYGEVRIWRPAHKRPEIVAVNVDLAKAPDGNWLVGSLKGVEIAKLHKGSFVAIKRLRCGAPAGGHQYHAVTSSPDGSWIASAVPRDRGATICLWNAADRKLKKKWRTAYRIAKLAFVGDTRILSLGRYGSSELWKVPSGTLVGPLQNEDLLTAAFVKNAPRIITLDANWVLRTYDPAHPEKEKQKLQLPESEVTRDVRFALDKSSETLVIADKLGRVMAVDLPKHRVRQLMPNGPGAPLAVAVAKGGKAIAVSFEQRVKLWRDGGATRTLDANHVAALAFSPDGSWLATARALSQSDDQVGGLADVWSVKSGRNVIRAQTPVFLTSVAWSGNGSRLFVGGKAGFVEAIDVSKESRPVGTVKAEIDHLVAPANVAEPN